MDHDLFPHLILAPAESRPSILEQLSPEDRAAMLDWSDKQPPGPNGSVNLLAWPGMADALMRSISNKNNAPLDSKKPSNDK